MYSIVGEVIRVRTIIALVYNVTTRYSSSPVNIDAPKCPSRFSLLESFEVDVAN